MDANKFSTIYCFVHLKINWTSLLSSGRIVGGTVAADGIAPYQCSAQLNGVHECGCSIISQKFVVTAAHCFSS